MGNILAKIFPTARESELPRDHCNTFYCLNLYIFCVVKLYTFSLFSEYGLMEEFL